MSLVLLLYAAPALAVDATWQAINARTELSFYPALLTELGISIAPDKRPVVSSDGAGALEIAAQDGVYQAVVGGALRHRDGFTLRHRDGRQVLKVNDFRIVPSSRKNTFSLLDAGGTPLFYLDYVHYHVDSRRRQLLFRNMDLRLAPALAMRLGNADYAGLALGTATISTRLLGLELPVARAAGTNVTCNGRQPNYRVNFNADPGDDLAVDVALGAIENVGCTRCGGDRVNVVPAVTLRNVGQADVPWFWRLTGPQSIDDPLPGPREDFADYGGFIDDSDNGFIPDYAVQHPYLVWAVYRVDAAAGITMLGQSHVKHAFNAINSDCPCPESKVLWAENCADLYGINTNAFIQHLGPRDEITAQSAAWRHENSHFDPDGDLRFDLDVAPDTDNGPLYEQLTLSPAALERPGDYYVEAWYVTFADRNLYNSMGYRQITPTFDGTIWTFPVAGEQRPGPLLNAWVDPLNPGPGERHSVLCSTPEQRFAECGSRFTGGAGHVQLAVKTAPLDGGRYRYRYALMNLDYDARVRELRIPLPDGVVLSELRFTDLDATPDNDWRAERSDQALRWAATTGATALDWGTLYTFSFIADTPPVAVTAALESQERAARLEAATLAPSSLIFRDQFESSSSTAHLGAR